ncbi:MAG: hypothetical protein AAGC56_11230 [Pseudomonadota bacterium]
MMSVGYGFRTTILFAGAICQVWFSAQPEFFGISSTIGARSDADRTFLIPAGVAFAIWGPLFLGSFLFAIYHAFVSMRVDLVARVGWYAAFAFWGNALWALYTPAFGPGWASFFLLLAIAAPLYAAIVAVRRAGAQPLARNIALSPIFALAGWLTVATPAGLSLAAKFTGFNPLGLNAIAASLLVLVPWTLLVATLAYRIRSVVYSIPILWGLYFVYVANRARDVEILWMAAAVAAALIAIATVAGKVRRLTAA